MRLSKQPSQLPVFQFKLAQTLGLDAIHAGGLGAPLVKRRITEAELASDLLNWHTGFGMPQKAYDLHFAVFACSQVRPYPG